jgi:hypothetical protein
LVFELVNTKIVISNLFLVFIGFAKSSGRVPLVALFRAKERKLFDMTKYFKKKLQFLG